MRYSKTFKKIVAFFLISPSRQTSSLIAAKLWSILFCFGRSNFQFIWPWQEWAYVKDLPKWAPQRVFVQEVLEREIRLSYFDKIKQVSDMQGSIFLLTVSTDGPTVIWIGSCLLFLSQSIEDAVELEELLPPKAGPNFRYHSDEGKESTDGHRLSKELVAMVRGRKTQGDIISWVDEKIIPVNGAKFALDVVSQTLLDIGSKSFTHLITVLERYGQIISKLCPNEEMQLLLMDEVSAYWKNSTQMIAIAIDRMMGYRLLSNLAIVKWVFSPANVDQFHVSDRPWEVHPLSSSNNQTYSAFKTNLYCLWVMAHCRSFLLSVLCACMFSYFYWMVKYSSHLELPRQSFINFLYYNIAQYFN